jgi:hypothetical protein
VAARRSIPRNRKLGGAKRAIAAHGAGLPSDFHTAWAGGDLGYSGYIGMPYDPAEIVPVYGPAPAAEEPAEPARAAAPRAENDACRSERVTVPSSGGEREITVVRC